MRFDRPKVILIDLDRKAKRHLEEAGYDVTAGSFGSPYHSGGSGFSLLASSYNLPGLAERDVVIANLEAPEVLTHQPEIYVGVHDPAWWVKPMHNVADPRPVAMRDCRRYFDRILKHGGLVILLCSARSTGTYLWGHLFHGNVISDRGDHTSLDNWSFLSLLRDVNTIEDVGEEWTCPQF